MAILKRKETMSAPYQPKLSHDTKMSTHAPAKTATLQQSSHFNDDIRTDILPEKFFVAFKESVPFTDQRYLLGFRGFLTIQAFVWVYLQTFVPAAVKDSANTDGPAYQVMLRKSLSVLFWNESMIYSAFILLSGRNTCIPFLKTSTREELAGAAFRRGIRLWWPVVVALAVIKLVFYITGFRYVDDFKKATGNISFDTPYNLSSPLIFFNSAFNLFWNTHNFATQAASFAFPSQTLWVLNVIYMQSFTVYMAMATIPYTRPTWRIVGGIIFIITAFWVQSWAWYTITGVLFADATMNMDFKTRSKKGMPIWKLNVRVPMWILYSLPMAGGLTMQYLWTAWRPESANIELKGHTGLYYTGGLNTEYDLIQPQARDDNYLVLLGFFLMLETVDFVQKIFQNPVFVFLGQRSLSE